MSDIQVNDEVWLKHKFKIIEIYQEKGTILCEAQGENGSIKIECSLNDIDEDEPFFGMLG